MKKTLIFRDIEGLGKRLQELRKKLKLSATAIGESLGGINGTTITRWERGTVEPPLEYIAYIAEETRTDLNWLIFGIEKITMPNSEEVTLQDIKKELLELKLQLKETGTAEEAESEKYVIQNVG